MLRVFFPLLFLLISLPSEARLCSVHFAAIAKVNPVKIEGTFTTWYTTVDMGFHDKILSGNPFADNRQIKLLIPERRQQRAIPLENAWIMKGAQTDAASYYAKMTAGPGINRTEFYPIQDSKKIDSLLDQGLALVWTTYLQSGTVKQADIDSFIATERELAPQRKVTFVTSHPQTQEVLAITRIYDGTPFPTMYFSDMATHLEAPKTDPRLPIERRYPSINLREKTQWIVESGRSAKSPKLEGGVLEFQFYNLGLYLMHKFGFLGVAPKEYLHGHVRAEITGRNLAKFMRPFEKDGFGFTLDYIIHPGKEPKKLREGITYEELVREEKLSKGETETKFLLYCEIHKFINNFYTPIKIAPSEEVYPGLLGNQ